MRSSGTRVVSRIEHHECDSEVTHLLPAFMGGTRYPKSWPCEFNGEVDVDIDPETYTASWECPRCSTVHDVSGEVFP